MDLGPHAAFIVMAYAATGLILAGLIAYAALDHRAQARALARLEARGVRRRSARPSPEIGGSSGAPFARADREAAG